MHAAPAVPAGRVAGLARTWVGQPRYYVWPFHGRFMGQGNPLAGVELYYGRLDATGYPRRTGAYVSITEFPRANAEVRFEGIGRFPSDGNAVVERGRATLRVGHLYVIVEASDARRALDAVRALLAQP